MMLWTAPTLRHQSAKGWLREANHVEGPQVCLTEDDNMIQALASQRVYGHVFTSRVTAMGIRDRPTLNV
jgi:hypothetical protein